MDLAERAAAEAARKAQVCISEKMIGSLYCCCMDKVSHCSIPFTPFPGKQGSKARHFFKVHNGGGHVFPQFFM